MTESHDPPPARLARRAAALLALLALSCAARADDWFPLTVGATWEYDVLAKDNGLPVKATPAGNRATIKSAAGDEKGTVILGDVAYQTKDDGVYAVGQVADGKLKAYDEPRKIAPAAFKLGAQWNYREPFGQTTAACLETEAVKVPAGEYVCAKVYLVTIGGQGGQNRKEVYRWFARGVGLVREVENTTTADGGVKERTTELAAYTPARKPAAETPPATQQAPVATTPAGAAPAAEQAASTERAKALLATAQAAARKGDHAAALRDYDAAIAADPRLAAAHAYKTLSLIARRDYDAAEREVAVALAADPADYTYAEIAGQLKVAQGKTAEGKALYDKAAGLSPAHGGAVYTDLAAALSARNDERLAGDIDAALKSAAAANPPSAPALFALGQGYANAGRPEARQYLTRYVEVASALPEGQRDDRQIRLARQLIRAIDIVKGAP